MATARDSLITQIPEGLRDVIGKRLTRLSEECNRVLSVAAVMGATSRSTCCARWRHARRSELLSALEEAMGVSLLEEHEGRREVRYRFTHAYFRQTLYEEMIAPRRLRMHNEVAKALEAALRGPPRRARGGAGGAFAHSSSEEDLRKAVHTAKWRPPGRLASTRTARRRGCWSRRSRCRRSSTRTTRETLYGLLDDC